jgi:hypothetical protein
MDEIIKIEREADRLHREGDALLAKIQTDFIALLKLANQYAQISQNENAIVQGSNLKKHTLGDFKSGTYIHPIRDAGKNMMSRLSLATAGKREDDPERKLYRLFQKLLSE